MWNKESEENVISCKSRRCVRKCTSVHDARSNEEVDEMVEPSGIEPLTSCVQGRRSPS